MPRYSDRAGRPGSLGFARERGGNVAILFAFLGVPMLMFTGAAIDYGFATRLETKLQAATVEIGIVLCM